MHTRTNEIRSFLQHADDSLAIRRTLDTALDTGDMDLISEAIALSRTYRENKEHFYEKAATYLQKLEKTDSPEHAAPQLLLTASNIGKTYVSGGFTLRPISLQVYAGSIIGVVGQNGHGKTTLLRCIAGQLAHDSGELVFEKISQPDYYSIKQQVAFIPQRIPRWRGGLKDNLHFSAALSGIEAEENEVMVNFMLERLSLANFAHLSWDQVSSGYRTRFEIARILLQRPDLLILDEPLANLDINAQQTILTDLRYMAKSLRHPMGILLSSQQLHEVEKVADTVILIRDGECMFNTGTLNPMPSLFVLEIETTAGRDRISEVLGDAELHFNGGFFTISSVSMTVQEMIRKLAVAEIPLTYTRDISRSTKRFF